MACQEINTGTECCTHTNCAVRVYTEIRRMVVYPDNGVWFRKSTRICWYLLFFPIFGGWGLAAHMCYSYVATSFFIFFKSWDKWKNRDVAKVLSFQYGIYIYYTHFCNWVAFNVTIWTVEDVKTTAFMRVLFRVSGISFQLCLGITWRP